MFQAIIPHTWQGKTPRPRLSNARWKRRKYDLQWKYIDNVYNGWAIARIILKARSKQHKWNELYWSEITGQWITVLFISFHLCCSERAFNTCQGETETFVKMPVLGSRGPRPLRSEGSKIEAKGQDWGVGFLAGAASLLPPAMGSWGTL